MYNMSLIRIATMNPPLYNEHILLLKNKDFCFQILSNRHRGLVLLKEIKVECHKYPSFLPGISFLLWYWEANPSSVV
jgi:hypothetical protein